MSEDPIEFSVGDLNLYVYVSANPVFNNDPSGLEVQFCKRPAEVAGGLVDHHWLKTDTVEAGMGNAKGGVPGEEVDSPFVTETAVTDHSGQSKKSGAVCTKLKNVNEKKVNEQLEIGKRLGVWTPTNQCQTFVKEVIEKSKETKKTK